MPRQGLRGRVEGRLRAGRERRVIWANHRRNRPDKTHLLGGQTPAESVEHLVLNPATLLLVPVRLDARNEQKSRSALEPSPVPNASCAESGHSQRPDESASRDEEGHNDAAKKGAPEDTRWDAEAEPPDRPSGTLEKLHDSHAA